MGGFALSTRLQMRLRRWEANNPVANRGIGFQFFIRRRPTAGLKFSDRLSNFSRIGDHFDSQLRKCD
jgi:hypothetical protein